MKILMCPPTYFEVFYEINPWMHVSDKVDINLAKKQWDNLYKIYVKKLNWQVLVQEPVKNLPDMVFTANAGLIDLNGNCILPTFRSPERQPETKYDQIFFESIGYKNFITPSHDFEGEGDALFCGDILFMGYPWRSDKSVSKELEKKGIKVVPLQLTDARFYHLDTALTIIDKDTVALWPGAFSQESVSEVKKLVKNVIEGTEQDALKYGFNAISNGKIVVMPEGAQFLEAQYKNLGLEVITTSITEFQKSGGGVKCLSLILR
jgi:N-dimethylarginine dimethylaminohydrolase